MLNHNSNVRFALRPSTTWFMMLLWIVKAAVVVIADAAPGASNLHWGQSQVVGVTTRDTDRFTDACNHYGGMGIGQASIHRRLQSLGETDYQVCCSAECGEFCGAANCELAPAGSAHCCGGVMTQWCRSGVSAPCLLDMEWIDVGAVPSAAIYIAPSTDQTSTTMMATTVTTTTSTASVAAYAATPGLALTHHADANPRTPINMSSQYNTVMAENPEKVQRYDSRSLLWWIVLVAILGCFAILSFICLCKKSKVVVVAAADAQPDLEASQASSSPLMFKGSGARDLSVTAGANETLVTPGSPRMETQPSDARRAVPMVWVTPGGDRTVYVTKKPLGVQFHSKFPLTVKREPEGHGKELGVQMGWILKSVDGVDVTRDTDINEVLRLHGKRCGSTK